MTDRAEKAERAVSSLMRLGASAALPLWALAMVVIGAIYASWWWAGCGLAVGTVGAVTFAGSPLAARRSAMLRR